MKARTLGAFVCIATLFPVAALADATGPKQVKFADMAVSTSLTGHQGDAAKGADVFKNKKLGNCLACHVNGAMPKQQFQGNVGPSLDGVASRYSAGQLRAIVVNAKKVFGKQTVMPGFYTLDVGLHVRHDLVGKTILSPEQVEDVVAYLQTLKK